MDLKKLQELCLEADGLANEDFVASLEESLPLIKKFCDKYSVSLIKIELDLENRSGNQEGIEPLYIFSDGLGGYNQKGIRDSL